MGQERTRATLVKWSELVDLAEDYQRALCSPSRLGVHFGCECGCGGVSYTIEEWDEEERQADKAISAAKEFCEKNGIIFDGIEE